jgi:NADH:ubiquinone oxidoreductase subunit 6 (subunit J)
MSIFKTMGIIIGIIIAFFLLKYTITNWKILKKNIYSYFVDNFGSFFYMILFTSFFIFTIYPLLKEGENLEDAVFTRKMLFLFMFVIIIIYSIWIYKLHKTEKSESSGGMTLFYALQFIIITYAVRYNSLKNFNTFPYFLLGDSEPIFTYLFWIIFWGILIFFSYYLFKTYKVTNSNNITATSITQATFKYLCIFIIVLFTSKLFFNRKNNDQTTDEYKRNFLTFNTKETNLYISYLAYFFIISNMFFLLFNSSFIKWTQIIILGVVLIFVIFIILFMMLFKFTNKDSDGTYFNSNYIFLFILFLLSFLILFKINPENFLQSSMGYIYVIGFVFGLVILFSLSIIFNNKEAVNSVFKGAYSTRIKYGIVVLLFLLFIYFVSFYVKKAIGSFQGKLNGKTNSVLFNTGSILVVGLLAAVFIGIYFLINSFDNDLSYIFNMSIMLGLVIICYFFFKSVTSIFNSHSNTKVCAINNQLWKAREMACIIFLIAGVFCLSFVKRTTTPSLDIVLLFGFVVLGYYIGGMIYQRNTLSELPQEKENCNNFLNTNPRMGLLETIKVIIMISIVVVLFFSMNVVIKNLTANNEVDPLFKYFLGLFFILMFFIYFRFSNSSFIYIIEILNNVLSKNYFSSPNTHKFNDFLFLIFIVFVFFSSMGLLERSVVSSYIQEPKNYVSEIFGFNKKNKYFDILTRIYNLILLLFNAIMFIPCIFNDIYLYFYETTKTGAFTYILIIEFCLILFYILYRKFINIVVKRHTEKLILEPTWLYPPTIISNNSYNTEEVNGVQANVPDKPIYNFGISFWIYIEPGISNNFLNILNYNNSPAILYKPSMNSLIVASQLNPENTDVEYRLKGTNTSNTLVNETIKSFTTLNDNKQEGIKNQKIVFTGDLKLQTWNNIFVNYNDGVIDVFINGILMSSNPGNMIDASTYKNLITIGNDNENSDMKICNLCFYNKNLNIDEIFQVYDSCKNLNPPLRH